MRAEILGFAGSFTVEAEERPDGSWSPPASVTVTLRPCWQKPVVRMDVRFVYLNSVEQVAFYEMVKEGSGA